MIVPGANPAASEVEAVGDDIRPRRTENISQLMKKFEGAVSEGELAGTFGCKAAAVFFATLQNGMSLLARDGGGDNVPMAVAWSGGGPFEGMTRGHRRG